MWSVLSDFLYFPAIFPPFYVELNDPLMEIRFKQYTSIEYAQVKPELNSILMERSSLNDSLLNTVPKPSLLHFLVTANMDLRQGCDYGSESWRFVDCSLTSKRPRSDWYEQLCLKWFGCITSRFAFSVVYAHEQTKSYRLCCSSNREDSWLELSWATSTCRLRFPQ